MQIIEVGVCNMRNVLSLPKCDNNYIQYVCPPAGAVNCLQCTYSVYYFLHSKQMSAKRMFIIKHLLSNILLHHTLSPPSNPRQEHGSPGFAGLWNH